jgi:hypothetical protein
MLLLAWLAATGAGASEAPPLLKLPVLSALARETSGESARRHLEYLTRLHRMRGSEEFGAAARHVAEALRNWGLQGVEIESYPADGERFYGTQRSRPAWKADFAELWEMDGAPPASAPVRRVASWEAQPLTLAQDSVSGEAEADLVDVGAGTSEADYAGREVRGRLVLASAQPGAVAPLAVGRHGAAGIVSYAQNQPTAWSGDDDSLVRWGHLEAFAPVRTFAFMVSLRQARTWRERLARGEAVRLRAVVRARREPGAYEIATAVISGQDAALRGQEIAVSCHLDHPRPGANDNASGCAAILEAARTLARLVGEGAIPRPARTVRFVWPPEIEGTMALLAGRPERAARTLAAVHLDMVGGGPETKAVFHVTRGPASLPSFVNDVAEALASFANAETRRFAATGQADFPLVAPEGGREPLRSDLVEFTSGSDHQVYAEGSFRIPAVYMNDWPDRYIHTSRDLPAHIDPTKLKRAAFLAACSAYFLAAMQPADVPGVLEVLRRGALRRAARVLERRSGLAPEEGANLTRFHLAWEAALVDSVERFAPLGAADRAEARRFLAGLGALLGPVPPPPPPAPAGPGTLVYRRNPDVKGPMSVFGYDYLEDRYGSARTAALALPRHEGRWGEDYAYEALNLVDGRRSVQDVRDALSAINGPVPLPAVAEYLAALAEIGVLRRGP